MTDYDKYWYYRAHADRYVEHLLPTYSKLLKYDRGIDRSFGAFFHYYLLLKEIKCPERH